MMKITVKPLMIIAMTLLMAASSSITFYGPAYASGSEMTLYSIYLTVNPGQTPEKGKEKEIGDAVLLESDGEYLLMDCGAAFASQSVIRYVKSVMPYGKKLNVYISHFHKDHYGGFYDLARQVNIGTVYLPDKETVGTEYYTSDTDSDIETILRRNFYNSISQDQIVWLSQGSEFSVGNVSARVLGPVGTYSVSDFVTDKYGKQEGHYLNNYSLTTMFTSSSGIRFITGGDAEAEEENNLIAAYGEDLKADIMKLSHHALKTSSSEAFMAMVRPTYSFAENSGYVVPVESENGNLVQRFHTPAKYAKKYGIFYMVGSEKASLGINVDAGRVSLYRDADNNGRLASDELLSGWTSVAGNSAISLTDYTGNNIYYIDPVTGLPLTGTQYIDGAAYLLGSGGSLQKGYYTESGYDPFRWYGERLRYFTEPDENGIASMNVGIREINGKNYYFDYATGRRYAAKKGTDGSKTWKVVRIDGARYIVSIKTGKIFNYPAEEKAVKKIGKKNYTVDIDGKIIKVKKIKKAKKTKTSKKGK